MKVVILAGGLGTRLSEETNDKPKPMVEIGGMPIIWHIMKTYSHYGFNEFIICLGYKGYMIKEYFINYYTHMSDITVDLSKNDIQFHLVNSEPWKITLVDTGALTMTGGRIKKVQKYLNGEPFFLTYGDGVSNIDINNLLKEHKKKQKTVTVTSVQASGRFGSLSLNSDNEVLSFVEKPKGDGAWINGGFFVCENDVFNHIEGDETVWEKEPLESLVASNQVAAYKHNGFWKPMDTLRDKFELNESWKNKVAEWKVW